VEETSKTTLEKLTEIAEASEKLKSALIRRDAEAIWEAVKAQDGLAVELSGSIGQSAERDPDERKNIIGIITRIRRVQATNKALAGSFLRLVDRTLTAFTTGAQPGTATYGASGGIEARTAPILVQQSG